MPALSILIKPVSGQCNIDCEYCFYKNLSPYQKNISEKAMQSKTLDVIIKKAMDFAEGSLSIVFQGGEPTLCGLDFFRETIAKIKKYNKKNISVSLSIQTNGLLLNDEWAIFLKENNFLVGISLDGVQQTHDRFRKDYLGRPTFQKIMHSIELLQKYQVEFNILTVINSEVVKYPETIYRFYQSKNLTHLQFIECLDALEVVPGSKVFSLQNEEYKFFITKLFDLWYQDILQGRIVEIYYFDNILRLLCSYPPIDCGMWGFCSSQFIFEADGSVYPCDFYVQDKWCLGNIKETDFDSMKKSKTAQKFEEISLVVDDKCLDCKYFRLCRGGCRRGRNWTGNDKMQLNIFCETYQYFFDHCLEKFYDIAEKYQLNYQKL